MQSVTPVDISGRNQAPFRSFILKLWCLALLMGTSGHADAQGPAFSAKSARLLSATGWQQNKETGQWMGNRNVIDDRDSPAYWAGHTAQSFNWIQFVSLTYGKQPYKALLFEKPSGKYKDEITRTEWQPDLRTHFFIMQEQDFLIIRRLVSERKGGTAKISSALTGYISDQEKDADGISLYQDKYLLAAMAKTVDKPTQQDECMMVMVKVADGKTTVRFLLPTSCFIVDNFVKTAYFETEYPEFSKVLEFGRQP